MRLRGDDNSVLDDRVEALAAHGHPIVVTQLSEPYDLGGEFFRWEMATAMAGRILGINPFDQPNVEDAKNAAREALAGYEETGTLGRGRTAPGRGRVGRVRRVRSLTRISSSMSVTF